MRLARVPGSLLRHRLDGAYYDPLALELDARLRQLGNAHALESLRDGERPITNGVRGPDFAESSFKLIRLQDCIDWEVRPDLALSISDKQFKENARCRLRRDDVVVAIGGYVGNAAIVIDDAAAVIGQHSARVSLSTSGPMNPRFLVAYLNAEPGRIQFARLMRGTVQQGLNLEDVQEIAVPVFSPLAQRYIGDKVRQAERLRERARGLEAAFREAVAVATPTTTSNSAKTSRVATGELGRNLNPGAHTPDRRVVRAAVRGAGGRSLDELAVVESPTTDGYLATAAYVGLDAIDSATCALKPSTAGAEGVVGTTRLLREGPALSRLRPYLNKATYIPPTLVGGVGSTELLLVRPKAGVDSWFLYGTLKLESSVRQLNPVATGSTHPRVDREDVLDLLVPWRDDHEALGSKLRTAQGCYFASAALTSTATALVERLIDGRITEADLVAAQKALESGDRGADRDLLKVLRDSDAPEAKPLISDLDALYALLDESAENDA